MLLGNWQDHVWWYAFSLSRVHNDVLLATCTETNHVDGGTPNSIVAFIVCLVEYRLAHLLLEKILLRSLRYKIEVFTKRLIL